MSNQLLFEIANQAPKGLDELGEIRDVREWQVGLLGTRLLEAISAPDGGPSEGNDQA